MLDRHKPAAFEIKLSSSTKPYDTIAVRRCVVRRDMRAQAQAACHILEHMLVYENVLPSSLITHLLEARQHLEHVKVKGRKWWKNN